MIFGKKGVSPLIATVLLIAFAVALGAVVMNWGKDYVETTAKNAGDKSNMELACHQDIDIDIKEIQGVPKLCYNTSSTYVEFILDNNGEKNIEGMRFVVFDSSSNMNISNNLSFTIGAGGISKLTRLTHGLNNSISQVEFIPMIKPKGAISAQLCSKNALIKDDLVACS